MKQRRFQEVNENGKEKMRSERGEVEEGGGEDAVEVGRKMVGDNLN